jgi:magnesium transporter
MQYEMDQDMSDNTNGNSNSNSNEPLSHHGDPTAGPTIEHDEQPTQAAADLAAELQTLDPETAADSLEQSSDEVAAEAVAILEEGEMQPILEAMHADRRAALERSVSPELARQWKINTEFDEDTVGRSMEPPIGFFSKTQTVGETVELLRELVKTEPVTYCYVVDNARHLTGVLMMRDLLFSDDKATLESIMIPKVFTLRAEMSIAEAIQSVADRQFFAYPVCDAANHFVGLIRGQRLLEQQAFDLSAQVGAMVGVEKEERLATPWWRSLLFRHPWLQLNLLTAFLAAAVVGMFEHTLTKIVLLAAFLPVLAGQSGNTGCQALAVTLRGMTLNELKRGQTRYAVIKEMVVGFCNGALVGISAAVGMYIFATIQHNDRPGELALVTWLAMVVSCVVSGMCGVLVPTTLKRLGADPATASSIFLTTATDVVSMGVFLALATWLLL